MYKYFSLLLSDDVPPPRFVPLDWDISIFETIPDDYIEPLKREFE